MSQQTVKSNLFSSAKKVESAKESKTKLMSLAVSPELEPHLKDFKEAKVQLKTWEAKKEIAEGFIKPSGIELYLKEYKRLGRNIGSFKLGEVSFSIQDRYSKMEDSVAAVVTINFPKVVETSTEYLFDQEILKQYINEISEALQKAKGIPPEALASLILAKEVTKVKEGTIDTLATYGDQMSDVFQAISPIISLR